MFSFRIGLIVAVVFGSLAGCASTPPAKTKYDSSENVTTYETQSVSISDLQLGQGNFGGGTAVSVRALGKCRGMDCRPNQVTLIFQVSGSSNLRMDKPTIELTAGKLTVTSTSPDRGTRLSIGDIETVTGMVGSVGLSLEEFKYFAEAEEVSGVLASQNFTLSQSETQPFRSLLKKVEGKTE